MSSQPNSQWVMKSMPDPLAFDCRPNHPYLPVTDQVQLLYLLVDVRPASELPPTDVPVHLDIVVDKSDSMCLPIINEEQFRELARRGHAEQVIRDGIPVWKFKRVPRRFLDDCPRNIDYVKTALRAVIDQLRPDDRFSLVAFETTAEMLIPNRPGSERDRLRQVIDQLDELELGDETHIAEGIELGLQAVRDGASPGVVNRMIILTDGYAVDGSLCAALGRQAAEEGISISTMGLGADFNEDLLISLADVSGGHAYLIQQGEDIPAAFAQELWAVQSVRLRNLALHMRFMRGVEVRRAWRVRPVIADLGEVPVSDFALNLPLGDLEPDAPPSLLLELLMPPRPPGRYRLALAALAGDSPAQGVAGRQIEQDVLVDYTSDAALCRQYDAGVMNLVETVTAFKLHTRALREAQAGDVARATRNLRAAADRLQSVDQTELAEAARQEAARLELEGRASPTATKRLRYETRRLTRKLG